MNHNQSSTPKPSPCQPESFRASFIQIEEARMSALNVILGLYDAYDLDQEKAFAQATKKLAAWLAAAQSRPLFECRFWAALSASQGQSVSNIDQIIARASKLEQYIQTGSTAALRQYGRTGEAQELLSVSPLGSAQTVRSVSAKEHSAAMQDAIKPSRLQLMEESQPSESSFHVGCKCMMDVAGGGDNAAASSSDLLRELNEQQIAATSAVRDAVDRLRLQVSREIEQLIGRKS